MYIYITLLELFDFWQKSFVYRRFKRFYFLTNYKHDKNHIFLFAYLKNFYIFLNYSYYFKDLFRMVLNSKISKVWHGFGTMLNVERQEQKRAYLEWF